MYPTQNILFRNAEYNIVGHLRPDGDCVGSQLAIYRILAAKNIKCHIIRNDNFGHILSPFFTGYDIVNDDDLDPNLPLICVDCSDFRRTGDKVIEKYEKPYLNIDHHISNENYAEHNIVDAYCASTTELIANMLIQEEIEFDKTTAELLYLGILTDTGRLAYNTTTINTIKVIQVLMSKGISLSEIYRKIYERDRVEKYRLLERFLHRIERFAEGVCCISHLNDIDFVETGTDPIEAEGFVNYTRSIEGVKVGAFLEFHTTYVKCSMRASSQDFRMDLFAKQFGGGGHPAAAGFIVKETNNNFYQNFKTALVRHVSNFYNPTS